MSHPFSALRKQRVLAAILAALLSIALAAQDSSSTSKPAASAVESVAMVGFTVSDLDREIAFFTDVLSFEKVSITERKGTEFSRLEGLADARARVARLRLGEEFIELTQYIAPQGKAFPEDSRSNDRWFQHVAIIVSDMDKAYARLVEHDVRPASEDGPQRLPDWNKNAAGIRAFYFRDMDGHFLEILAFPEGKGDPKWHKKSGELFLGIDHTAIVVADTDASLRFYRDAFGFQVVGGSENYGIEQERLNNVAGAHLRITTLRPTSGPAIEFLEYLNPRDGRPFPADARTNDLLSWETTVVARDVAKLHTSLHDNHTPFISAAESSHDQPGRSKSFIVRDPDGHAVKVVEK